MAKDHLRPSILMAGMATSLNCQQKEAGDGSLLDPAQPS